MDGVKRIPIITYSFPNRNRNANLRAQLARNCPSRSDPFDPSVHCTFSLSVIVRYHSEHEVNVPIVNELANILRDVISGGRIPPGGLYCESAGKHYLVLECRNQEVLVLYEKNLYRVEFKLNREEVQQLLDYHEMKKWLTENQASVKGRELFEHRMMETEVLLQAIIAGQLMSLHEVGECACEDAVPGWPCELSQKRSIQERMRDLNSEILTSIIKQQYAVLNRKLGFCLHFTGLDKRFIDLKIEDNTLSRLLKEAMEPETGIKGDVPLTINA